MSLQENSKRNSFGDPSHLNGLLQLKDRGMKLSMSLKVTVHSGYGEAFPNTSASSLGCNTVALLFT